MSKSKTIDFFIASIIFILALIEFVSWNFCNHEYYEGEVKGSEYLLFWYPLFCTLGFLTVAIGKVLMVMKFKACVYTILVSWVFLFIQLFNLSALFFHFGVDIYNLYIYPIFLITIFGLISLKVCRTFFYT